MHMAKRISLFMHAKMLEADGQFRVFCVHICVRGISSQIAVFCPQITAVHYQSSQNPAGKCTPLTLNLRCMLGEICCSSITGCS